MSRPHVYLDLDRTLFQTGRVDELWQYIAKHGAQSIEPSYERSRAGQYYIHNGDLYAYDMSAHLHDLGLQPDEVYRQLAQSELADGRFEFADCASLVAYLQSVAEVAVLTYGTDDYQRFKAALCPSLASVPIITTLAAKDQFFHAHPAPAWLVDDKPIGAMLPDTVQFVQVSLEQDEPLGLPIDWPVYYSLAGVEQYFQDLFGQA